jgi:hypothetical protein
VITGIVEHVPAAGIPAGREASIADPLPESVEDPEDELPPDGEPLDEPLSEGAPPSAVLPDDVVPPDEELPPDEEALPEEEPLVPDDESPLPPSLLGAGPPSPAEAPHAALRAMPSAAAKAGAKSLGFVLFTTIVRPNGRAGPESRAGVSRGVTPRDRARSVRAARSCWEAGSMASVVTGASSQDDT